MPILFDGPYLLFTLLAAIPSVLAALYVKSTFARFARVGVRTGLSGAQAAQAVLRAAGVGGVAIERHEGFLSDHYDPRSKALRLSPDVHDGRSISSIAVAAHEAGHAIQDARRYAPLVWRSQLVPLTNIGNQLWFLPTILGVLASIKPLVWLGIGLLAIVVLFHFVTLPTEIDASSRAKAVLADSGIVTTVDEERGVAKVLNAAALTYVAAALTALLQLAYWIFRAQED